VSSHVLGRLPKSRPKSSTLAVVDTCSTLSVMLHEPDPDARPDAPRKIAPNSPSRTDQGRTKVAMSDQLKFPGNAARRLTSSRSRSHDAVRGPVLGQATLTRGPRRGRVCKFDSQLASRLPDTSGPGQAGFGGQGTFWKTVRESHNYSAERSGQAEPSALRRALTEIPCL